MKIGYVQFDCKFGQKNDNFREVERLIQDNKADIWVLPELFNSGYTFASHNEVKELSEPIPHGTTSQFLMKLSKNHSCTIVGGLAEEDNGTVYNSAICVANGYYVGRYRKCHLFDREKIWFAPGNSGFIVLNVNNIKIGMMICFDWIFPEASRTLALKGADLICHPSNLVLPYCQDAMVTRCIENRIFAITCNRIGRENRGESDLSFTGMSQITAPNGAILNRGAIDKAESFVIEIDIANSREKNITPNNHLFNDRQTQYYNL